MNFISLIAVIRLFIFSSFWTVVLIATQVRADTSATLEAGLAVRDITPDPQSFHVPLGGYGERMNARATEVHDSTMAKALILRQGEKKFALVTLDLLGVPRSLRDELLARIKETGIESDNLMLAASHTHASVEMAAMNRANVFQNPAIGIFNERLLIFTAEKISEAIHEANQNFVPIQVGSASMELPGMNRNRRGGKLTDNEMTVLRLDRMDGTPLVVHVNYTAHPTYMTAAVMQLSAGWPGYLQRTVESFLPGVTCMYSNGAEGDVAPAGGQGSTPFEKAENYGQRLAADAADLVKKIKTRPVSRFAYQMHTLKLPPRKVPKALMQSAGPEYGLNEENIMHVVNAMAPESSYLGVLQLDDFLAISIPGEMSSVLGLRIKRSLRDLGAKQPVIVGLGNEWISYILDTEEYYAGGYEPGVSFYGETLGSEVTRQAIEAGKQILESAGG